MSFYRFFSFISTLCKYSPWHGLCGSFCVFIMFFTPSLVNSTDTFEKTSIIMPSGAVLKLEVAKNEADRTRGLMYRKSLPQHSGMLFAFPNEGVRAFWMKNTYIPLSIAFITKHGVVVKIADMQPLSLQAVSSEVPVQYALEINKGAFASYKVVVGTKLALPLVVAK